jgi:hypothetical protein
MHMLINQCHKNNDVLSLDFQKEADRTLSLRRILCDRCTFILLSYK